MTTEVSYEIARSDLFRAYARILAAPRNGLNRQPVLPSSIDQAAAHCLNIVADAIDRRDPHLPAEWLPARLQDRVNT